MPLSMEHGGLETCYRDSGFPNFQFMGRVFVANVSVI